MHHENCKCEKQTKGLPTLSEYTDKFILPSLMPSKPDPWSVEVKNDMISGRPRTPNDQYTVLNQQQLKNLKKDSSPLFFHEDPSTKRGLSALPAPIDRYAYDTSQYLFRDNPPLSNPHCWIGDQWQNEPPEQHNTSRLGASLPWGPNKTGERTVSHFHKEDTYRYLNIDMYKRPPTNMPSIVVMKYGRPSEGYYQQRNPNFNTWFGSTKHLNETNILTHIQPKTFAEHDQFKTMQQNYMKHKASRWPEISEYSEKYLLRTRAETKTERLEGIKEASREIRRQEVLARSQEAQMETTQCIPTPVEPQLVSA